MTALYRATPRPDAPQAEGEPPPCAGEGHDHPAHDWRTACLNCGVFRGSDLYATPRPDTAEGVSEAMVERALHATFGKPPTKIVAMLTLPHFGAQIMRAALEAALARPVDKGEGAPDKRPANCRNRLRDEGKAYPRSGCAVCRTGGMTGCPHDRLAPTQGKDEG